MLRNKFFAIKFCTFWDFFVSWHSAHWWQWRCCKILRCCNFIFFQLILRGTQYHILTSKQSMWSMLTETTVGTKLLPGLLHSVPHPGPHQCWHHHQIKHYPKLHQCSLQPFHWQGSTLTQLFQGGLHLYQNFHPAKLQKSAALVQHHPR